MRIEKNQKFQILISIVVLFLAFFITWQVKGVRKDTAVQGQMSKRVDLLQQEYKTELEKNEKLLQQIAELQTDLTKYREQVSQSGGATKILTEQLTKAEALAGLTDVNGSGIIVTIRDGGGQNVDGVVYNDGYGIVHDTYLLTILNELRAAGAEALSVNNERILSTSEIRCVGPVVSINNTKYAAPYEIRAIGNPETLENTLRMPGGVLSGASFYGVEVTVKKSNNLLIKKYTGASTFEYAQVVEPEVTN